jgi:hypothetical protein
MEIEKAVSFASVAPFWDSSRVDMSLEEACRVLGRETGVIFSAPPELHQWEAVLDAVFPQLVSHGTLLRALIVLTPDGADPMVVSALSGIRPVPLFL